MEKEKSNVKEFIDKQSDEHYGLILPDNDRVNSKLLNAEMEKKRRIEEELQRKLQAEEATNQKNLKMQKDEMERERRRREMESAKLNYEKFADSVEKGEGNLNEIFSLERIQILELFFNCIDNYFAAF